MKLSRADREIESLIRGIRNGALDLQPDFQRGDVWRVQKQQLLIDSILRNWYVPPIHVIEHEDSQQEVLDGQQRLRAIVNFVDGAYPVDGYAQPYDNRIVELDHTFYGDLSKRTQQSFLRFTIAQYTLTEFSPQEPAELFFRLNQYLPLTPAETRNAFVGETREQIKTLVSEMWEVGLNDAVIGFSNARMSYDDVLSRVALALEWGTIIRKITSRDLAERYRKGIPFAREIINQLSGALRLLGSSRDVWNTKVRFNKATLFSWLWFIITFQVRFPSLLQPTRLGRLLSQFEAARRGEKLREIPTPLELGDLIAVFQDRATARVADVASVVIRDVALWLFAIDVDDDIRRAYEKLPKDDSLVRRLNVGIVTPNETFSIFQSHMNSLIDTYT